LAAVAKTSEPQPAAAPKRVRYSEDTLQPDTTPPSVIYHTPAGKPIDVSVDWERKRNLPQLVSFGGDWKPEEILDAYRAMTEPAKGKTLTCSVCGKHSQEPPRRDPRPARAECVKALRKRHQAKSLARTAAKKAGA
jgi:hypothetical protein